MLAIKMIITDSEGLGSMLCVTWKKHSKDTTVIGKFPIAMTWLLKSLKSFTQLVQAALCGMFLMSTSSLFKIWHIFNSHASEGCYVC